ncbi:MAG: TRAP transporter large permease subunit, partial [Anaerolineales bacterium]|nr:TRAP transporter large permease subunit [Anaerolineales bacterium]
IILVLMAIFLLMGMLIDPAAIIMMTAPIVIPLVETLNIDPLWFGVMLVVNMCAGNVSPPMGLNLYIVKGLYDDIPMKDLFKSAWSFVLIDVAVILILMVFPSLATWLPSLMTG